MGFKENKFRRREEGFTLTEMIVTLVIISGVVTAFIVLLGSTINNQVLAEGRDRAQAIGQSNIILASTTPFLNLGFTEAEYIKSTNEKGLGQSLANPRMKYNGEYVRVLPAGTASKTAIPHKETKIIDKQSYDITTYFTEIPLSANTNNLIDDKRFGVKTTVLVNWNQNGKNHEVVLSEIKTPKADECISERFITNSASIPAQCKLYEAIG